MILKKISLTQYIFIGIILGVIAGKVFGQSIMPLADLLATLFLRLLKMVIMPLIITSIMSGVLSVGSGSGLGKLGLKTFLYYAATSLLAIVTGQVLVNIFKPGVGAHINLQENVEHVAAAQQGFSDLLYRIIPENVFHSMASGDVLSVIFFCILFAVFVTRLKDPFKGTISQFIEGSFRAMMKLTHLVIWAAPFGVFGINARLVATTGFGAFKSLGFYFVVVLLGLLIHAFINLPLLLKFVSGVNFYKHYRGMAPALLTAFSTSSSMVALPFTMECVTTRSRVSNKIANFVLPIGATVNMDGTALYECVAAIFIAQVYGVELGLTQQFIVVITALLASIGAAGIPMAGLVMLSIVLHAIGLPLEGVGIVLAVDRILDMFRTTTNVLSDSCGTVVIAKSEGESLEKMGEPAEKVD